MDSGDRSGGGGDWFESETFWARFFPFMFTEAHFTAAVENVPKIVALTGVDGGSVLDLACGPGRYAIAFAQAGFHVTGVDRTRFLLDKARERATQAGANVEWVEEDMREFVRPAAFDLALSVYTSFGYFDDAAENRRVLENILASLKPGGTFVFEHVGKEILAGRFQPTQADTLPDGSVMIQRRSITDDWSRIDAEWILLEGGRASSFHLRHWIYSGREIRDLLTSVGFSDIALYGGFDGSPYGPQAQRLIAVAKKPRA
jgi:SAM-dependent methyltransferase